jgi:hypothetical protein
VRDAQLAVHFLLLCLIAQFGDTPHAADALQASVHHSESRGVVTAVFETAQALQQYRNNVTLSYCADYPAHDETFAKLRFFP